MSRTDVPFEEMIDVVVIPLPVVDPPHALTPRSVYAVYTGVTTHLWGRYMATIEFVTIARHAEAHDGLLFLQGAGFSSVDRIRPPDGAPQPISFGVGVSILTEFSEVSRPVHVAVWLERRTEDGTWAAVDDRFQLDGEMEVGWPSSLPSDMPQRSVVALNSLLQTKDGGRYRVAAMAGDDRGYAEFMLNDRVISPPPAPSS